MAKSLLPPGGADDNIAGSLALWDRLAHPLGAHSASPARGPGDPAELDLYPRPHCTSVLALGGSMSGRTEEVVREERT